MTAPVADLARIAAALRGLDAHLSEHPELAEPPTRERFDAWADDEAHLEAEEREHEERSPPRPTSRPDRTP